MLSSLSASDRPKHAAARAALDFVAPGMRLGLGTGSTAAFLVRLLGQRVRAGLDVVGVPTSSATEALARSEGIAVTTLDEAGMLDLTLDGADEFDPGLRLIKGGGGALLQEKIVAAASKRMVVIADPGKEVAVLGAFPLPVEVVRFGWRTTRARIAELLAGADVAGREVTLRERDGAPFVSDEGHHILDLHLGRIGDPDALHDRLLHLPGVVETGLFIGMASAVVVGQADGSARVLDRDGSTRNVAAPAEHGVA